MAQHDYAIANQGFPAFRSDLNDALAAIVSNNSGATEPTTMFAHQMWVDTAANPSVLKIRNADNDAWITIGSIDQTGDTFTLTSAVSATTLNTSGAVVFNDSGADVDFRVEGDTDANLLFVDAGNDRVGVGTNAPATTLHIEKNSSPVVRLIRTGYAYTELIGSTGASGNDFKINMNGTDKFYLTNSGNVGIGEAPSVKLDVAGKTYIRPSSRAGKSFFEIATGGSNVTVEILRGLANATLDIMVRVDVTVAATEGRGSGIRTYVTGHGASARSITTVSTTTVVGTIPAGTLAWSTVSGDTRKLEFTTNQTFTQYFIEVTAVNQDSITLGSS